MTTSQYSFATLLLLAAAASTASFASSGTGSSTAPVIRPADCANKTGGTVRQLPPPSERWALVVGIGKYDVGSNLSELHGDKAATEFAKTLEERAGFRNDHIVLLADQDTKDCRPLRPGDVQEGASGGPQDAAAVGIGAEPPVGRRQDAEAQNKEEPPCRPTRETLLTKLQLMASEMKTPGLFVFFFSGHGQHVAGESVLFPAGLKLDPTLKDKMRDSDLKQKGFSGRNFAEIIKTSKAKQVLIFLDSCRNQLTTGPGSQKNLTSEEFGQGFDLHELKVDVEASMTFYSSGKGSASYEDAKGRSYFTSELVNAFDGRKDAYGPRNLLTIASLFQYVKSNVESRVKLDKGALQSPDCRVNGYLPAELVLAGREVPSGSHPDLLSGSAVLMKPDGTRVYVANSRQGVVNVFDTATGQPQKIIDLRPGAPGKMVMAARRGRIYVTEPVSQTVVVINAANQKVLGRLPTGVYPEDLALTPDEAKLYVANQQPAPMGTISVFDLRRSGTIRPSITGVNCPEGLAMAPDGALMYVETQCAMAGDPLFVVDTKTDRVDHSFPDFSVGSPTLGMLPNGEKLYIATGEPDRTRVLITATGDVKALGPLAGYPAAYAKYFAATPDGKYVLGVGGSHYMLVIDAITDEVVQVRDLGSPGGGIVIGIAPGTTKAVCYVWLPDENRLFFTGLEGILSASAEH